MGARQNYHTGFSLSFYLLLLQGSWGRSGVHKGMGCNPGGPWLPSGTHLSVPRVHAAGCLERPRALAEVLKRGPAAGAPFRLQAVVGAVVAVLGAIVGAVGASMPQEEVSWTPK